MSFLVFDHRGNGASPGISIVIWKRSFPIIFKLREKETWVDGDQGNRLPVP